MIISVPFRDQDPRLRVVGAVLAVGLLVLLAALWRVQVVQAEHFGNRQQAQSLRRIRLPSARGEIVDRHGMVLANNRPSYDIVLYLEQLGRQSKKQDIWRLAAASLAGLSQTLHLPLTLTERDVRLHYQKRRPIPLAVWRDVSPAVVAAFAERASALPGTDLVVTPVRQYPHGGLAAHVLGYVASAADTNDEVELEHYYYYQPDSAGQQGVESACDVFLRGSPGGKTIRVSPGGTMVADLGKKPPERGGRVVLALDGRIQQLVEDALRRVVLPPGKTLRGAAVVLDVRTGEVLALTSVPAFDPNLLSLGAPAEAITALFNDKQNSPMLNRAIGARYAPGSMFKTITLLAGLQAGTIHPQDRVVCHGALQIGDRAFGCWNRSGHGSVDALRAIKESCDVWFYQEGMATGVETIDKMAAQFGLGAPTGLDVGHDRAGLLPGPGWKRDHRHERWWNGDTAQLAIGQSFLLVTPLQMASVAATFANGGTVWRPYLVKRIEAADGDLLDEAQPEVRSRLAVAAEHVETVRRAMLAAVQDPDGTVHRAAVNGLSVAGKTGTAEYDAYDGPVKTRRKRAWFMGFAPYEQPQVAVAVLIEDADSGGHTAAPVAGQILAGIFGKALENAADRGQYGDEEDMNWRDNLRLLKRLDWLLFAAMVALAVGSVLFIYSASYRGPGQPMPAFYRMQMVWFGLGLALYLAVALIDYRLICQWAAVWYVAAVGLLVVVLVAGAKVYGARRWLGVGSLGIQPAEIGKLAVIVAVSYYLFHRTPELQRRWSTVGSTLGLVAVPVVLIMLEPDLGSAMVLVPIAFGLMFVAGVRVKHLIAVALLAAVLGAGGLTLVWKWKENTAERAGRKGNRHYQKQRLLVFVNPDYDPLGAGWNVSQSRIAVGSGGLTGKGYLQGTQNLLGYLPRSVTPNDFLFSVIAEEQGFVGSVAVLGVYGMILFCGLRIATQARDRLGMLLATGVVAMLFFHVFINVGMTIGLMPVTGLPLPLLSYGGSFVLASMAALGLLQNVWIHRRIY